MSYFSTILADNPSHYWRVADPGGGLLFDLVATSPKHLALVSSNQPLAYAGPSSDGGSGWFDARTGAWFIDGISVSSPQSIECWIWGHDSGGAAQEYFSMYQNLQLNASAQILFASGGGNVTSPAAITMQKWHHLVGTYGPTHGIQLWIDGVNVVGGAYGGAWGPTTQVPAVGMSSGAGTFAAANIAECAVYPAELSSAQVASHFAAADSISTFPAYKAAGTFSTTSGGGSLTPADVTSILNSVRKTY